MPRDYKAYSSKKRRSKQKGGNQRYFMWSVVIILIVLFASGLYWLAMHNKKLASMKNSLTTKPSKTATKTTTPPPADQPVKFEFYNILPKETVSVPNQTDQSVPAKNVQTPKAGIYIVQVASAKTSTEADSLKAKLLLNGFDVQVLPVNSNGATWYRVQIGPYNSFDDAYDAQNDLRKKNFDGVIKKIK